METCVRVTGTKVPAALQTLTVVIKLYKEAAAERLWSHRRDKLKLIT